VDQVDADLATKFDGVGESRRRWAGKTTEEDVMKAYVRMVEKLTGVSLSRKQICPVAVKNCCILPREDRAEQKGILCNPIHINGISIPKSNAISQTSTWVSIITY
jgi:hypothetical protein